MSFEFIHRDSAPSRGDRASMQHALASTVDHTLHRIGACADSIVAARQTFLGILTEYAQQVGHQAAHHSALDVEVSAMSAEISCLPESPAKREERAIAVRPGHNLCSENSPPSDLGGAQRQQGPLEGCEKRAQMEI